MINFKRYISDIIYLFYPENCSACGKALYDNEKWLCSPCQLNLPYTNSHTFAQSPYNKIFWGRIAVEQVWPYLEYKKGLKVQRILHRLKYRDQPELGTYLGEMAAKSLDQIRSTIEVDCIIPVPMHYKKLRKRGYNQAALIAQGYSKVLNIPVMEQLIVKNTETQTQTKKNRFIRYKNAHNVFTVKNENKLKEIKGILIVDDVITTGATIEALITCILSKNPEIKIYVATLAAA